MPLQKQKNPLRPRTKRVPRYHLVFGSLINQHFTGFIGPARLNLLTVQFNSSGATGMWLGQEIFQP